MFPNLSTLKYETVSSLLAFKLLVATVIIYPPELNIHNKVFSIFPSTQNLLDLALKLFINKSEFRLIIAWIHR